jgi:four helix bundle protein
MFLQKTHTKLHVFQISEKMTLECYKITKQFPSDERFAMVQQIRRAALSVHLNIAEGCPENQNRKEYVILKFREVP